MMNPLNIFRNFFKKKEEEDEIPESWKNQETLGEVEIPKEKGNPSNLSKALTVVPHFPKPKKIIIPHWLKMKRITALILMIFNIVVTVGFITINPLNVIFYILTALILLDYLFKTRPKKESVKWYHLDNIEEE